MLTESLAPGIETRGRGHLAVGTPVVHATACEARQTPALTFAIEESARSGRSVTLPA